MGYKIRYDTEGNAKRIVKQLWIKKFLVVFCVIIGMISATMWVLSGDWMLTRNAMNHLSVNISQGENIKDAFSSFCLEILQGTTCE